MLKPGKKKGCVKTGGRKAGTPNKVPTELREMILESLRRLGGVDYLVARGSDINPAPFLGLVGKVVPKEFNTKVESDLTVNVVTGIPDGK